MCNVFICVSLSIQHVHVCICIYIYICMYIYIYMYIHIYKYICARTHTQSCPRVCVCARQKEQAIKACVLQICRHKTTRTDHSKKGGKNQQAHHPPTTHPYHTPTPIYTPRTPAPTPTPTHAHRELNSSQD